MKKRYLIPLLLALSGVSLFVGITDISLTGLVSDSEKLEIFLISRLPRLVAILVVGAGMSVAGVVMQQITSNKFVSPSTAGTLEFTRLGVLFAIFIIPGASVFVKMSVAFVFALAGTLLFVLIINRIKLKDSIFIPLVGMMFGGIISSITSFIAYQYDLIQNITSWLQGSFSLIIRGRYELLYIGVPLVIIAYLYAGKFTIAGLGKDFAANLGLNYKAVVLVGLIICSLLSAVVVVTVGSIPFVGVIVPNIVSLYKGDNLKATLPYTALLGSAFVLFCDILGRLVIYPYEIPISVTAGTIGSAVFLYLILRNKQYGSSIKKQETRGESQAGGPAS